MSRRRKSGLQRRKKTQRVELEAEKDWATLDPADEVETETSFWRNTFSKFLEKYFQQLIIAGRPPKRLKGVKLARRSFRPSNSSSFDPSSPASSDVDVDVDYKSFLDDESDVDSLSALPSSEDNFLSPR